MPSGHPLWSRVVGGWVGGKVWSVGGGCSLTGVNVPCPVLPPDHICSHQKVVAWPSYPGAHAAPRTVPHLKDSVWHCGADGSVGDPANSLCLWSWHASRSPVITCP